MKTIDKRFIEAVSKILADNKRNKIKPDSERSMSRIISNDPTTIRKIKTGSRGVTMEQLEKFANHFGVNFNYFFQDHHVFRYKIDDDFHGNSNPLTKTEKRRQIDHLQRMQESFGAEVSILAHTVVAYVEEIRKLEKRNTDSSIIQEYKKALNDGGKKLDAVRAIFNK